jgi:uncharacterized membrane protein (DUF4010 family)
MEEEVLQSLVLCVSLSALVGMIRQWSEQSDAEADAAERYAGIRTFTLWGLLGFTTAMVASDYLAGAHVAGFVVLGLSLTLKSVWGRKSEQLGYTTVAAALLVYTLGAVVFHQWYLPAVMVAALTILILGLKRPIHAWTRHFTEEDIRSTLQFIAVTGVILPLVPNRGFGPMEAINPYSLWLMVVLISGLGFVGYILIRLLGARSGVVLAGLVGGLASSTATTLAFSRSSRQLPQLSPGFALAIVLACTVMLGRVLVIIGVIHAPLVAQLWLPFLIMALPGCGYALFFLGIQSRQSTSSPTPELSNPLGFATALKFALIYGLVTFLVKAVGETELADKGLLVVGFLSGLTDLDAIALSLTNEVKDGGVVASMAARAIVIAAIANTLLKAGLAVVLGDRSLRGPILLTLGLTVVAGSAALLL